MKFFGFLIFLILATLAGSAVANDELDAEVAARRHECLKLPYEPVCGTGNKNRVTYQNECEMKCFKSKLVHPGECNFTDLLYNKGINNNF